jgi:hypothetical protein
MGENAVTYEQIVLNAYQTEHILMLEMEESINSHGTLYMTAVIPEETAEQYVYETTPMMPVTLSYLENRESMKTLCRGLVANIQVSCQGNIYQMDLMVKGKTWAMDIIKRSRSFQDISMTVHQLIREVMSGYADSDCIIQIPDEPIGELVIQYQETDWEFLMRFVSMYGAVLIPDMVSEKLSLFVGIPKDGVPVSVKPYQYHLVKRVDEYLYVKKNIWPDALEVDFVEFQFWDYQIFRVGNSIDLNSINLAVQSVRRVLSDGILKNQYGLRRKNGLRGLKQHNEAIVGASVTGFVMDVSRDKVKVQLEIDEPGKAQYWFPYSTMSASPDGSGWYCMPEKGDQVRVYFPTNKESDAYAVSAVSGYEPQPGDTKDLMGNPNVKYLRTKADQLLQFAEEGIIINSGSGQATIFLGNSGELMVYGSTNVNVTAQNTLSLISKGQLLVGAENSVCLKKGEGTSITLDKDGNIRMEGSKIYSN